MEDFRLCKTIIPQSCNGQTESGEGITSWVHTGLIRWGIERIICGFVLQKGQSRARLAKNKIRQTAADIQAFLERNRRIDSVCFQATDEGMHILVFKVAYCWFRTSNRLRNPKSWLRTCTVIWPKKGKKLQELTLEQEGSRRLYGKLGTSCWKGPDLNIYL